MLPTIKKKSTGDAVRVAQYLISHAARETADGVFSADFTETVKAWQKDHALSADGIIGEKTWRALTETLPTVSTAKNRTSAYTSAVQILLGGIDADGIFGNQTKKAVAAYQSAKGLQADGIVGKKTWSALILGEAASTPVKTSFVQPKDFKQSDSRWGKNMYSNHNDAAQTMSNSGCGPTAMADIVATVKDSTVTPYDLAQFAMKRGDRTYSSGTSWSFFRHIQEEYRFTKMVQTSNLATLMACLDAGGYAVASMGPGYWTSGGHFICVWKYDDTYIYANDPASSTRKKQKITDFTKERKQYFCFYA